MRKKKAAPLKIGFKFVLGLGVCAVLIMGLGVLRYHSAQLAWYLESVNQSIKKYSDEEIVLRQELSALLAPVRIYSYCKESLGMEKVLRAETISIRSFEKTVTANKNNDADQNKGWRSHLSWLFGR